jgi:hypothetical protein
MFHAAKLWSKWRGFDPKVNIKVEEKGMHANLPLDIQALVSHALHRQIRLSEFSEPVYIEDAQAVDHLQSLQDFFVRQASGNRVRRDRLVKIY